MTTTTTVSSVHEQSPPRDVAGVPLGRVVRVELRKMFNTRSGFWLIMSIVLAGLAATVGTILFASDEDLTYDAFAAAIGFPMTVILPMIAILSITGEWSQRTGLTTFTLVPHRGRVLLAKTIASVVVGVVTMFFALAIGVVGNLVGSAIADLEPVWDISVTQVGTIILGNLLCLLTGTMLGVLIRNSAAALVTYFVMTLVLPTVAGILASKEWFRDLQPWVDANFARGFLFDGAMTVERWANVAVTVGIWLVLPALLGIWLVRRSEVK